MPGGAYGRRIAFGGVCAGVSLLLLFLASLLPPTLVLSALAGIPLSFIVIRFRKTDALCCYGAVSLLALLFLPDKTPGFLFLILFGIYPVLKSVFEGTKKIFTEWLLKILYAEICVTLVLLTINFMLAPFSVALTLPDFILKSAVLVYIFATAAFVVYDMVFSMLIRDVCRRLRL